MKKYKKEGQITPCKLNKDDLYELVQIIKKNLKKSNEVKLYISYNPTELDIQENSIDELLKHNELPNTINQLSLRIQVFDENLEIIKTVDLRFYNSFINLRVEGLEETWVLGKYKQIHNYLNKKKPWFLFILRIYPLFYFLLGAFFPVSILGLVYFISEDKILYSISSLIFLISLVLLNIFKVKSTLFPYTQIIIKPKNVFINKENIVIVSSIVGLFISIIGLFVSIIGGIIIPLFYGA